MFSGYRWVNAAMVEIHDNTFHALMVSLFLNIFTCKIKTSFFYGDTQFQPKSWKTESCEGQT